MIEHALFRNGGNKNVYVKMKSCLQDQYYTLVIETKWINYFFFVKESELIMNLTYWRMFLFIQD